jgi:hypothetical protein
MDREPIEAYRPVDRSAATRISVQRGVSTPVMVTVSRQPTGVTPVAAPQSMRKNRVVSSTTLYIRGLLGQARRLQALLRLPNSHRQRFVAVNLAVLLLATLFIQVLQPITTVKAYALSSKAQNLIGASRDDASQYLKLSSDKSAYEFIAPAADTAAAKHGGRNDAVYSTSLSLDAKQGITYTDTASKIGITVVPQFDTMPSQKNGSNSIVYPSGADQLVYTHKYNGLKEDIIVPAYRKDQLQYKFELRLPSGVEARLDKQGNIGIYSGDSTLFGNVTFGSDKDRALVDKARENSAKTNLVATIPYPIVKDANGKEYRNRATYSLSQGVAKQATQTPKNVPAAVAQKLAAQSKTTTYQLTITAQTSKSLSYPISVDPTIQSMSASDWSLGDAKGVDVDTTNNLIRRSPLTGGALGAGWTTNTGAGTSTLNVANGDGVTGASAVAYNGFMYVTGGVYNNNSNLLNTVQYGAINADGHVSTWATSGAFTTPRLNHRAVVFGGYLYIIGGQNNSTTAYNDVQYAKLNPLTGAPGTWLDANASINGGSGTSFTTARALFGASVANGYLYIEGGGTSATTFVADSQYAKINANGSLGSWTAGTTLPVAQNASAAYYNGYMYVVGGCTGTDVTTNCNAYNAVVYYASVDVSTGALGAWTATSSYASGRSIQAVTIVGGYLYSISGIQANTGPTKFADSQYAAINADGTLGTWATSTSITTARFGAAIASYNNYIYIMGGSTGTTTVANDTQYAKINAAGITTSFTTSTAMPSASYLSGSTAWNGYLYDIGGCNASGATTSQCTNSSTNASAVVRYGRLGSTGTVTWATTTSIPTAKWATNVIAHSGYLYVIAGAAPNGLGGSTSNGTIFVGQIAANGTIASWTTQTSKINHNVDYCLMGLAAYNGFLYLIGGASTPGDATTNLVEYLAINSDGTLGTIATGTALPNSQSFMPATIVGSKLYYGNGSNLIVSPLASNGFNGAWSTAGTIPGGLPITSFNGGSLVYDRGYFYLADDSKLIYAPVNSDGTTGTWTALTGYSQARQRATLASYAGYLYIFSGCTNTTAYAPYTCGAGGTNTETSIATAINGGSGLNDSVTTSAQTMTTRRSHQVVALNGYLYAIAGCTNYSAGACITLTNAIQYSLINTSTGDLGAWSTTTNALPVALQRFSLFINKGYIYVTAGCSNVTCNSYNTSAYYATPDANGNITAGWVTQAGAIPSNAVETSYIALNNYAYRIGGNTSACGAACATTEYAPLTPAVGSWTTTTSLVVGLNGNGVAQNNGFIYSVGGNDGTGARNFVQYAHIQADHSLGGWARTTDMIKSRQAEPVVGVYNGFMYVAAGYNTTDGYISEIEYATILPSGQVSIWQVGAPLATARADLAGAIDNGKLYVVGGSLSGSTTSGSVEYMRLQSVARKGSYSRVLDFDVGVLPTKLVTRGTSLDGFPVSLSYLTTNAGSVAFSNSQLVSGLSFGGATPVSLTLGSGVSIARYLMLVYLLDDSASASFPDEVAGQSSVTNYDLYFTPNPGTRLRGGQTFTTQKDRGLQATQ